ncbi:hypothetical protein AMATHDRAFT_68785 [Amanita thiersii Skay4041]|uniref:Uncharacterized protein n=1 Tax=Amanita thiersii Skay4041 TaxID=703135 RepID=A0A2A9NC81_9AGAR|nr:hypothetical protein AMATHDRAFT_68785 [Amanita thiersii Skay4041]
MVPTSRLPPIRSIGSSPIRELTEALDYLQDLYLPPVRGSRCRQIREKVSRPSRQDPQYLDAFERNHATKWLTGLVSHLNLSGDTQSEILLQRAASLLALCSGSSAAGTVYRDYIFSSQFLSVTVRVKDVPLDNDDFASVGAQTWRSACVLAECIVDEPWRFGLCHTPLMHPPLSPLGSTMPGSLRILELGAGTGLVSLTITKVLQEISGLAASPLPSVSNTSAIALTPIASSATIVATDYYSPVLSNLASNIGANFPSTTAPLELTACFLDWSNFSKPYQPPSTILTGSQDRSLQLFNEKYDVIFGADIIYEPEHTAWIKSCVSTLLRIPDRDTNVNVGTHPRSPLNEHFEPEQKPHPAFHLMIPLRSTHLKESQSVELLFPFSSTFIDGEPGSPNRVVLLKSEYVDTSQPDFELCILEKETIICDDGRGEGDEEDGSGVVYIYYKIGWGSPKL